MQAVNSANAFNSMNLHIWVANEKNKLCWTANEYKTVR